MLLGHSELHLLQSKRHGMRHSQVPRVIFFRKLLLTATFLVKRKIIVVEDALFSLLILQNVFREMLEVLVDVIPKLLQRIIIVLDKSRKLL